MQICKVIGNIWSTKKNEKLEGVKLMIVRPVYDASGSTFIAADPIGAGIGETVLVVTGSTARIAMGGREAPVDAAITGIVDSQDISE